MAAMHIHTDGDRQPVVSPSPSCDLSTDCKFVVGTVHRLTNDPFDSCSICVRVEETYFTEAEMLARQLTSKFSYWMMRVGCRATNFRVIVPPREFTISSLFVKMFDTR